MLISQLTECGVHLPHIEHEILTVIEVIPMMILDLEVVTNLLQNKFDEQNMLDFKLSEKEKKQSLVTGSTIPPIPEEFFLEQKELYDEIFSSILSILKQLHRNRKSLELIFSMNRCPHSSSSSDIIPIQKLQIVLQNMTQVDIDKRIRLTHVLGALIFEMIAMKDKPQHSHDHGHDHHHHDQEESDDLGSISEDSDSPDHEKRELEIRNKLKSFFQAKSTDKMKKRPSIIVEMTKKKSILLEQPKVKKTKPKKEKHDHEHGHDHGHSHVEHAEMIPIARVMQSLFCLI